MPSPWAARQTSVASPSGSAAAQQEQSLGCLGQLTGALEIESFEVAGEVVERAIFEAACELRLFALRGGSSDASGLPRVSAMMRPRTRSSSWPGTALTSRERASSSDQAEH